MNELERAGRDVDGQPSAGEQASADAGGLSLLDDPAALIARLSEIAAQICTLMGVTIAAPEVELRESDLLVRLAADGAAALPLEERTFESLQFVLNKAIQRTAGRRWRVRLLLPEQQAESALPTDELVAVATAMAAKAKAIGRSLAIGPLSGADLRLWEFGLQRSQGAQVGVVGSGDLRRLVVASEGVDLDAHAPQGRRRRRKRKG
jgi:predicted RNA-binding protein Jag